jgi:RND superfamily putative drug exporter
VRRLAETCYGRRRWVVVGWLALLAGLWLTSSAVAGKYGSDFKLPGSESQRASDLLETRGLSERGGGSFQVVFRADNGIDDPAVRQRMEQFFSEITTTVDGVEISDPYEPANSYQVNGDGRIAFAEVFVANRDEEAVVDAAAKIKSLWRQIDVPGLQVELGGADELADASDPPSELIGIGAAVIILIVAFGSLMAMGLPIVVALFGLGSGLALISLLTRVLAVPQFATEVAALLAIGVGIDYALLIVTRYRQGLRDGLTPRQAVALSLDTSGRAVLFAGLTVEISLLGMFLLDLDFMRSIALACVFAVLMTMLASITLLPAMLGFVGHQIDRFGLPHRVSQAEGEAATSFWYRLSRVIQARPWLPLLISGGLLVALTLPLPKMRLSFSDAGNRPPSDTTRRAYDLLSEAFGPGFNGPIYAVVDTQGASASDAAVAHLVESLDVTPGVSAVSDPEQISNADLALLTIFPDSEPQSGQTTQLLHRLRDETIPAAVGGSGLRVLTTGPSAFVVDFSDYIGTRLAWFVGAVLALSFLLLLAVFHSLIVPVKAVLMNLLSIGAALGATILVFQQGFLASILGVSKNGPVEAWAPMFIFAIVFGLSMDYEVFLLSRVREEYDRNAGDNSRAVADGLAATGRVISAAALIMVCVFGSFIFSADRGAKMIGFSLAFAVFIDATVVRLVLVPSAMELMGRANWWAPAWLVRRLPRIRVDSVNAPLTSIGTGPH